MTIELRPMGVACNLACTYCYQEPIREAGNVRGKNYDLDKMLEEVEKTGQNFHLFGGEALMVPKEDLEILWKYGYEKFGQNGMQSNGTLIDDDHIKLFKKYNVSVGISVDGPEELNSLREVRAGMRGTNKKMDSTNTATQKTIDNIKKMKDEGVNVSVIVTLHQMNASEKQLPKLLKFMRWLGDIGVKTGNLHTLEVDATMPDQEIHVLPQKENIKAFLKIAEFLQQNPDLRWAPFTDYASVMRTDNNMGTCIWKNCDPHNTQAVYGIEGDGSLSNCGRTNKEGIEWYKADDNYFARYISFYYTPQNLGGCKGCKFWLACSGSCPGEAMDNDFRNKTIHCATQKSLLGFYEEKTRSLGIRPYTEHPQLKEMEELVIEGFKRGERISTSRAADMIEKRSKEQRQAQKNQPRMVQVEVKNSK